MTAAQSPSIAGELRAAGLRVTAARVALLDTVRDGDHLGVEAIAAGVRDRVGYVSLQAVYDALHALTTAGLVRRIEPAGSPARYEGRLRDNHHHVVCRSCGSVADVQLRGRPAALPDSVRRPRLLDRRSRGHLLGPVPRLFRCPQFLGTVIRTHPEGFHV